MTQISDLRPHCLTHLDALWSLLVLDVLLDVRLRLRLLARLVVVVVELLVRPQEGRDEAAGQVWRVGQGDGSTKVGRRSKLQGEKTWFRLVSQLLSLLLLLSSYSIVE